VLVSREKFFADIVEFTARGLKRGSKKLRRLFRSVCRIFAG